MFISPPVPMKEPEPHFNELPLPPAGNKVGTSKVIDGQAIKMLT